MTKRLLALTAPVAAMGAALLLGACGQSGNTAASAPTPAANVATTPASTTPGMGDPDGQRGTGDGRGHQVDPPTKKPTAKKPAGRNVNCGPVTAAAGAKYVLIADSTPDGTTGCTEAFNVLGEYQKAPADQGDGGSQRNKKLSGGWSCGTDGGSGSQAEGLIACANGKSDGHGGVVGGLAFHTERAG